MRRLLSLLLCACSFHAHAALMSPVLVDGNEWLQPVDFVGLQWADIAGVCDPLTGACAGALNGNDMSGWSWASSDEVAALFGFYFGTSGGYLFTGPLAVGFQFFADGWVPTQAPTPGQLDTVGFVKDSSAIAAGIGHATSFGISAANAQNPYPGSPIVSAPGGWFSRVAAVPSPATLPLLCLALAGLFSVGRPGARSRP